MNETDESYNCDDQRFLASQEVLVLNSWNGWKPAVLADSGQNLGCFERDAETEAFWSCSISWENQMYIYGGHSERRQISRLEKLKLKRVGHLLFDHQNGACSAMGNDYIFLCFSFTDNDENKCRQAESPRGQFTEIPLATRNHLWAPTAASDSKLNSKYCSRFDH